MLKVRICDSGCGFDTLSNKITSGLGFFSMRERLRSAGGTLSIYSEPMLGTRIEAFIPIKNKPNTVRSTEITDESERLNFTEMQQLFNIGDTTLEAI